ncbi:hypothetical protein B9Z19DRAFT_1063227 [Tuber borchii]|uniref:Uncharacterized protein n=1 Tax=Tuber borchii TaxID=42251 RepID=A0A2T6ZYX6_TUBBO|nr:hypothetical protein B9Z19DRAFT_1063227 [Tuber borchii]
MTLYGCPREVYHPLSSRAEPTAVLFYESSDDDGDLVGLVGNKTPPAASPKSSPRKIVTSTSTSASTGAVPPPAMKTNGNVQVQKGEGQEVTTSGNNGKKELGGGGLVAPPNASRKQIGMGGLGLGVVVRPENTFGDRSPFRKGKGRGWDARGRGKKEDVGNVDDEDEEEEVERRVRIPGSFDFDE